MSSFQPESFQSSNSRSQSNLISLLNSPPLKCVAYQSGNLEGFENSLSTLQRSLRIGAFGAELTIRKTKDNVFVAIKDENLKRLTGQDKNISEIYYKDIGYFKDFVENGFGETLQQKNIDKEKPAELSEIFKFMKGNDMVLFLDLRQLGEEDVLKVLFRAKGKGLLERIIPISSISPDTLMYYFRKLLHYIIDSPQEFPPTSNGRDIGSPLTAHFFLNFFKGSFNKKQIKQKELKEQKFDPENFEDYHLQIMRSVFNSKTIRKHSAFQNSKGDKIEQEVFLEYFEKNKSHIQFMNLKLKEAGIPVMYYLANSKEEFKQAIEFGANIIITSRPTECELFRQMFFKQKHHRNSF